MTDKISIRFFKDHEVQAIWDEEKSQWWFSVLNIVGAIRKPESTQILERAKNKA